MKHFTMQECIGSRTAQAKGFPNIPTPEHNANIETTVALLLDPLRDAWAICCSDHPGWGTPAIRISSGYRGLQLNAAVGGAQTSAHCVGYAFDLIPMNGHLGEFKDFCRQWVANRPFDQLISEDEDQNGVPVWMHIGYKDQSGGQRRQLLSKRAGVKGYSAMTP